MLREPIGNLSAGTLGGTDHGIDGDPATHGVPAYHLSTYDVTGLTAPPDRYRALAAAVATRARRTGGRRRYAARLRWSGCPELLLGRSA